MLPSAPMFYSQETQSPASSAQHRTDVSIPMRDGVELRADILLPSAEGKFPALIYRTPYGKHFALKEYKTFEKAVARGYAVVVQDVRGRYASDGEFVAYQNEGRDGFDTIRGAMACRGGKPAAPESHGAGHDVFHAAQFLLLRRRVR